MGNRGTSPDTDVGNIIATTREDTVTRLASLGVDMTVTAKEISDVSGRVADLTSKLGELGARSSEERASAASVRAHARDEALRALHDRATLAEVFPLLALGLDCGEVDPERLKAVQAEAEHLAMIELGDAIVRANDGLVTSYVAATGIRPSLDNTRFVLGVVRQIDNQAVELSGSLNNLVTKTKDGRYVPAHGIYVGSQRIREGLINAVATDPTNGIAWMIALQTLNYGLDDLKVSGIYADRMRVAATAIACDLGVEEHRTRQAIQAAVLLCSSRQYMGEVLTRGVVNELRRALTRAKAEAGVIDEVAEARLRRSVGVKVQSILDIVNQQATTVRIVEAHVEGVFSKAKKQGN